jgi:hypothetical protein
MRSNKRLNTLNFILILIIVIVVIVGEIPSSKDKLGGIVQNLRFKTITKNMQTKKSDNITYYYLNKEDESYINIIKEYLRVGEDKTSLLLGHTTMYPFNITMFTTSEAFGEVFKVNSKESQAVTILNSLYIPCDNINPYVFVHEYTHYKINSFCKQNGISISKIPIWFSEGVAEYTSSTLFPYKFRNPKIQKIQDFRKLDKLKQMLESENNEQSPYMQSYIAIKKLIEIKGTDYIQSILLNTKSMTFYDSFEKVVGLSIEDFQKTLN